MSNTRILDSVIASINAGDIDGAIADIDFLEGKEARALGKSAIKALMSEDSTFTAKQRTITALSFLDRAYGR